MLFKLLARRTFPCVLLFAALLLCTPLDSVSQQTGRISGGYSVENRPDSVAYRVLPIEGYDLIYQAGHRASAERVARILHESEHTTHEIMGDARPQRRMPVVLNAYNDRSNGFVRPFPFKQEIEIPSIRNQALTARYASWFDVVVPHELTHALHAEYAAGFGVGAILGTFAPDIERALNLGVPRGWVEGVAVYRESYGYDGAGRLGLPAALMSYRAALGSDTPWRLSRLLYAPRYTQPFDRHYIGGGQLFRYLVEQADEDDPYAFFHRTLAWYHRFPLLGYGPALWYGMQMPPPRMSGQLVEAEQMREAERLASLGPLTDANPVVAPREGRNHRRPLWTHPDTLVVHRSGYSDVPGVYTVHVPTGQSNRVAAYQVTGDYHMHLAPDSQSVWMSRYEQAATVPRQAIADVETVDLETGHIARASEQARLLAPSPRPDGSFWAAEIDGPEHRLALRGLAHRHEALTAPLPPYTRIQQLATHPTADRTVALLNQSGVQMLYTVHHDGDAARLRVTPLFAFEDAVIYDVSWGPDGATLLISADPTGVPNVFAIDLASETVRQVTNEPYGALEPALSPGGERIAYVRHAHERHDLVAVPFVPDEWDVWEGGHWRAHPDARPDARRAQTQSSGAEAGGAQDPYAQIEDRPYRSRSYLRPRIAYPTIRIESEELETNRVPGTTLGLGVGLGIGGADPLQQWAYQAEAYYQAGRVWGEARVQTSRLWGQPGIGLYRRPFTVLGQVQTASGGAVPRRLGAEERGIEMTLQQPIVLRSNVYRSQLQLRWRSELRQTRLFADFIEEQPLRSRVTLRPSLVYAHRLQQNTRDLVPRTGWVMAVSPFLDVWTDGVSGGRALQVSSSLYVPGFDRSNTGIRLGMSTLAQNRAAIFDLDLFVPRGYSNVLLPEGIYTRFDLDLTQPVWYPDWGSTLLPVYLEAGYLYGSAQALLDWDGAVDTLSSATVGMGVRTRLFYNVAVDLRVGATYRIPQNDWAGVFR